MRLKLMDDNSVWYKQQYEISNINGIDFISIKNDSEKEFYDPLEKKILPRRPHTEKEHLFSSPHIALGRIDPENIDELLFFVNTWGLLGLQNTRVYTNEFRLSEILDFPNLSKEYPYIHDLYNTHKRKTGERKREPVLVFQQAVRDYQQMLNGLLQFQNYSIPTCFKSKKQKKETIFKMEKIFEKLEQNKIRNNDSTSDSFNIDILREKNDEIGKPITKDFKAKMIAISEEKIHATSSYYFLNEMLKESYSQIFWNVEESSESEGWGYKSLLAAIYLRVKLDRTEGKNFRRCNWHKCKKLYIPYRDDNKTCSKKCRSSLGVHNHNLEKYLEMALEEFSDISPEKVIKAFHSLIESGCTGEKTILKELKRLLLT
ncbi:hypothetical protein ACN6MT_03235 [Neobacillus niacini]|uniref:hypothetical protein n=1 Tax=Neobacillus niacini TaxID=86668 RepID=UPI003B02267F